MKVEGEGHFIYRGARFPDPGIGPVHYRPEFFQSALDLESDLFAEMRETNGIEPARVSDSDPSELERIAEFFVQHRDTYFFLFDGGDLVGDILVLGNRIQSLCVSRAYQRRGFGTKLTAYAVNVILDSGYSCAELETLPGNVAAERLYLKMGFKEKV
jgi:ribosomal protein S18 acetylase RimI-like enzyme